MNRRALIVAVEASPGAGLAALPGTERGALLFREWLIHTKGFTPDEIVACAGPGASWRTRGTSAGELEAAVRSLEARGARATDELHVFVSGWGRGDALLVPGDDTPLEVDLRALRERLARALGPGRHSWFLDLRPAPSAASSVATAPAAAPIVAPPPEVLVLRTRTQAAWPRLIGAFSRVVLRRVAASGETRASFESHRYVTFDVLAALLRQPPADAGETLVLEAHPLASHGYEVETDPGEGYREEGYELVIGGPLALVPAEPARAGSASGERRRPAG